jgi:hypothetical protein
VLTAHERLTVLRVVIHLPRCCAPARKAGVRSECGYDPREARLQAPSRPPLQPEQESAQPESSHPAHPIPKKAFWCRLKSHR